jgi:ribosomal protein L37AE/L43A
MKKAKSKSSAPAPTGHQGVFIPKMEKPATNRQTPRCPECASTAIGVAGQVPRCNACGYQWPAGRRVIESRPRLTLVK